MRSVVLGLAVGGVLGAGCVLGSWCAAAGQNPVYESRAGKPFDARVKVLALSTSVRQSYAGNEEVYLGLLSGRGHEGELARLVDEHRSKPIQRSVLEEGHALRMRLTRTPGCDAAGSGFFLGREADVFDPHARALLQERGQGKVPCYRIDHEATRLAR